MALIWITIHWLATIRIIDNYFGTEMHILGLLVPVTRFLNILKCLF